MPRVGMVPGLSSVETDTCRSSHRFSRPPPLTLSSLGFMEKSISPDVCTQEVPGCPRRRPRAAGCLSASLTEAPQRVAATDSSFPASCLCPGAVAKVALGLLPRRDQQALEHRRASETHGGSSRLMPGTAAKGRGKGEGTVAAPLSLLQPAAWVNLLVPGRRARAGHSRPARALEICKFIITLRRNRSPAPIFTSAF